jgi:large subunit ribosomal protein L32
MAVPRNRLSNSRKNSKRSHHAKSKKHLIACSKCSKKILPHCVCEHCGCYNDKQYIVNEKA